MVLRTDQNDDRGSVIPLVALAMVILLVIVALVIDIGFAKQYRREAQASADSAALAAAQDLGLADWPTAATATAKRYASENLDPLTDESWAACHDSRALPYVPTGTDTGTCVSFDSATTPTKVRVRVPGHETPAFFGSIAGRSGYDVTAAAEARRTAAAGTAGPCGLCVIDNGRLQLADITKLEVTGGEVWAENLTANSNGQANIVSPLPISWRQGSYEQNQVAGCSAPDMPNQGSNWGRNDGSVSYCSRYRKINDPVPNPFAAVTVDYTGVIADTGGLNINSCAQLHDTNVFQPDRMYVQTVEIPAGCHVDLEPNRTYYFRGNLHVKSGASLTGTGNTLVFGCASSGHGAACTSEGGKFNFEGTVNIAAPTSGPYAKLAILFDPGNRGGSPNQVKGDITLDGAIYAKQLGFSFSNGPTLRAWTVVAGAVFDFNSGTMLIDNTKMGGSGSSGSTVSIELVR